MPLHDSDVHAIARRPEGAALDDLAGAKDVCIRDRENVVHDIQYELKGRPDRFSLVDRGVPAESLLEHFGVGHKPLSR